MKKPATILARKVLINWQKRVGFPDFKFQKKFNALISKGIFNKNETVLALPKTFMNQSGIVLKKLIRLISN